MNYYFIKKHKAVITLNLLQTIFYKLILTTLILTPIAMRFFSHHNVKFLSPITNFIGYSWIAFLFLFLSINIFIDLVLFISEKTGYKSSETTSLNIFKTTLFISILILAYGSFEAKEIKTEHIKIKNKKIKENIKIIQISDTHFSPLYGEKLAKQILKIITKEKPDIVLHTGDFADKGVLNPEEISNIFKKISPPLGKYAITGNHEYINGIDHTTKFIKECGFTLLIDKHITPNKFISIIGIDDKAGAYFEETRNITEKELLKKAPKDNFVILAKHQPYIIQNNTSLFNLQLSGHTHAGQIFPFSLLVKLFFKHIKGHHKLDQDTGIYINRGTGTWGPPFRFLAPPEITVIILEKA